MDQEASFASKLIALGDLSILADVSMPREQLLTLFTSKIHTLFDARAVAVWLYDYKQKSVSLLYEHGFDDVCADLMRKDLEASDFPEVRFAIESGAVWTTEDISDSGLFTSDNSKCIVEKISANAVMGVPLRALKAKMGAISFYYEKSREFDENEKALALAYANALALSLNNVDSYTRLSASERMKSEIVSTVAHQFRTPIAVLRGNVELLKEDKTCLPSQECQAYVEEIDKVGKKMKKFVDSFLNVKAIEEGRLEPKIAKIDLVSLIKEAFVDLEAYKIKHGVELEFKSSEDVVWVMADDLLASEVVLNVLNNGIKYAKTRVQVSLDVDQAGQRAVLTVTDDGAGIPIKEQSNIFQKLYRASNVLRHPEASSGLGLYIAKEYANKQGGDIWFESSGENQGSKFYISLPLA